MADEKPRYNEGGLLPPGNVEIHISDDECVISFTDIKAGRWVCSRALHKGKPCQSVGEPS
jgi:hypothetical protein